MNVSVSRERHIGGGILYILLRPKILAAMATATALNLQIFGTRKCPETRKAERFFKERRIPFHSIDLAEKGPSAGELRKIAQAVGGIEKLIDRQGVRYAERGLKYAAPTGPRIEQALLEDPRLLRTPIVRAGARATVGFAPDAWLAWLEARG